MSTLFLRTATAVALGVGGLLAAPAGLVASHPSAIVRVYADAALDPERRRAALETATRIIENGGVTVEWRDCSDGTDTSCQVPARTRTLVLRIVSGRDRPAEPAAGADTDTGPADLRLGTAVVDARTHTGTLATVYLDRVEAVAERLGMNVPRLLGRAMAHELGHLLLRTPGHSATGLMRAVWTQDELLQNRVQDWVFAGLDRQRLRTVSGEEAIGRFARTAEVAQTATEARPEAGQ